MTAHAARLELINEARCQHLVYEIHVRPAGAGRVDVVAHTGRAGRTLLPTVIAAGVPANRADGVVEKTIRDKVRLGYRDPNADPTDIAAPEDIDMLPALLVSLHHPDLFDFTSAQWLVQQKYDGENRPIRLAADGPQFFNRDGRRVVGNPSAAADLTELFRRIGPAILNCEDMGPAGIYVFDMPEGLGVTRDDDFATRNAALRRLREAAQGLRWITVCPAVPFERFAAAGGPERLRADRAEGYVLKRADAPYKPGRGRSVARATMLKVKFIEDATFRIGDYRHLGPRSVPIETWDQDAMAWIPAGRVSIPVAADMPEPGSYADVRYLYASAAGVISQPVWKGVRPGAGPEDCRRDKLKLKRVL